MTSRWTHSPAAVLSAALILGTAQAGVVLAIVSWRYVSAFEGIARTGSAGLSQFLPLATGAAWAGAATAAIFVLLIAGALLVSVRQQAGRTGPDIGARSRWAALVAVALALILAAAVPLLVLDRLEGLAVYPIALARVAAGAPPAHSELMGMSGRDGSALMSRYLDPATAVTTGAGLLAASLLLLRVVSRAKPARSMAVGLAGVMTFAAVLACWQGWRLVQLPGWIAHAATLAESQPPRMR
jgi:hypothetical protein